MLPFLQKRPGSTVPSFQPGQRRALILQDKIVAWPVDLKGGVRGCDSIRWHVIDLMSVAYL